MIEFAYFFRIYILPVPIIAGIFFNFLSILVMRRMRASATSSYMSILGLVDSGVLIVGGISLWMHTIDSKNSPIFISPLSCKLIPFFLYSLMDLSVFIIVIMTYKRFYAVLRPLQANRRNKKNNKLKYLDLMVAIILALMINSHFVYTHTVQKVEIEQASSLYDNFELQNMLENYGFNSNFSDDSLDFMSTDQINDLHKSEIICIDVVWHEFYEKYWLYIDASIYSFVPSFLLMIFNVSIIRSLYKGTPESLMLKETSIFLLKNSQRPSNLKASSSVNDIHLSPYRNASKHYFKRDCPNI